MNVHFIPTVLSQHCEEASFLWVLRQRYLARSDISLADLAGLDERIDAHLDGIRVIENFGWKACQEALANIGNGETFTATVLALESRASKLIAYVASIAEADPDNLSGLLSAVGWASQQELKGVMKDFIFSDRAFLRQIGIAACTMHKVDPGPSLTVAVNDADTSLRARGLRVVAECGRSDLLSSCVMALADKDAACRFWAARSAALLGERDKAIGVLQGMTLHVGPFRVRALQLLFKLLNAPQANELLKELGKAPANIRLLIQGAGITGDPFYVPWLIKQMDDPKLARLVGESFTYISGLDLAYLHLDRNAPENFESGPNNNPDDSDVSMDEDDNLPWPDPIKIQSWWDANKSRFTDGVRYFMGEPVSRAHCIQVLKEGYQRQRIAAALYLCLLEPGTKLFPTSAPAWRQKRWLSKMS